MKCVHGHGKMEELPAFVREGAKKRMVSITYTCGCGRVVRRHEHLPGASVIERGNVDGNTTGV